MIRANVSVVDCPVLANGGAVTGVIVATVPRFSFFTLEKLGEFVGDLIREQQHGATGTDAFLNLWTCKYSSRLAGFPTLTHSLSLCL